MKRTINNIAVLSDIHGNYIALEECIRYAVNEGAKEFILLGDYLGELPYPQKTMDIIYSLQESYKCHFVRGNKEDYWINYEGDGERGWKEYDSTTGALYYTYHNLTEKDKDFFKGLPLSMEIEIAGLPRLTVCHGSPCKTNEKMLHNDKTYEIIDNSENTLILCGHTHIQDKIERNSKLVLNAGAVGVSLNSGGKSQFMMLKTDGEEWSYEFVSVEYDVTKVIEELEASGLSEYAPYWTIVTKQLLLTAKIPHSKVLVKAMDLCYEAEGDCEWPDVPEKYWKQAIEDVL